MDIQTVGEVIRIALVVSLAVQLYLCGAVLTTQLTSRFDEGRTGDWLYHFKWNVIGWWYGLPIVLLCMLGDWFLSIGEENTGDETRQ